MSQIKNQIAYIVFPKIQFIQERETIFFSFYLKTATG